MEQTQPIHFSIARGCVGFRRQVAMAFFSYIDVSGTGIQTATNRVVTAGGFIAHESAWARFEPLWLGLLGKFGLSAFHMKDYAHGNKEFKGWLEEPQRRIEWIVEMAAVIKECDLQPFGATLPLKIYHAANRRFQINEVMGAPYTVAVSAAIARSAGWRDSSGHTEPILTFVEKGDNQQADLRRTFAHLEWDDTYVAEPIIRPKKSLSPDGVVTYVRPFEPCDFVVYEMQKATNDVLYRNKDQVRQSIRAVLPPIEETPGGETQWVYLEQFTMINLIKRFRIPRRSVA